MKDISRRRAEALNLYRIEYENKKQQQGPHDGAFGDSAVMNTKTASDSYDTVDLGCGISYPPIPRDKLRHDAVNSSVKMVTNCEPELTSSFEDTTAHIRPLSSDCDEGATVHTKHKRLQSDSRQISLSHSDCSDDRFECPSCSRTFDVNKVEGFLQHTENCL